MGLSGLSLLGGGAFRALAASVLLNSVGMMGEAVVLGWLALELTDSPFLVGAAMGARALPLFLVGVPAGALADRVPRRRLLMLTGAGQAATTVILGVLTLAGWVSFPVLLLVTGAAGTLRAVEHAARQGYAHDVVGAGGLVGGLAVLGVAMRAGWLLGSLVAGTVIAAAGSGGAYLVIALGYLAGAGMLRHAAPPAATLALAPGSMWQGTVEFLRGLRQDRVLVILMALTAGAEILGFSHQTLLPSLARDVLRAGPEGLGAMNAARAVGGILGLAAVTAWSGGRGGGRRFLAVLGAFGASLVVLGVVPDLLGLPGVLLVLVLANAMGALADLLAQSLLQLRAPDHLRGRAGGAWVVAIGLAPVGQLQIGALASLFGVGVGLGASGTALLALAGAAAVLFPRLRRL